MRGHVFVTGASRGIGRGIAMRLAGESYDVTGCFASRSIEAADTEKALIELGVNAYLGPCDVGDLTAVNNFVVEAEERLGPITAVVNSAGITRDASTVLMRESDWQAVLRTNLTGTWNVCHIVVYRFLMRTSSNR